MALQALAAAGIGMLFTTTDAPSQNNEAAGIWTNLPEVAAYLESGARDAAFSGVALIAREDNVVFHEAYGYAEAEHRVPMRP